MGILKILSEKQCIFKDRVDAGRRLSREFKDLSSEKIVVLGIPRGGLLAARALAETLDAPLDFILSRKLRSFREPEAALGAVNAEGDSILWRTLPEGEARGPYLEKEKRFQIDFMKKRAQEYRAVLPKIPLHGKIAIVIDDGMAMGLTLQMALEAVRKEKPAKLIAAVPVGPPSPLKEAAERADETICLCAPQEFNAVSDFYQDFSAPEEKEVMEILQGEKRRRPLFI